MSSTVEQEEPESDHEHRSSDEGRGQVEDTIEDTVEDTVEDPPVVDTFQSILASESEQSQKDDEEEEADVDSSQVTTVRGVRPTVDVTEKQEENITKITISTMTRPPRGTSRKTENWPSWRHLVRLLVSLVMPLVYGTRANALCM
jgi:hypothetical protein